MATYSNSPRIRAVDPATPVHSPHHSVHSSSSSRLSVRNLTIHEYRKQQNSPASCTTPPGKTLRRKAAASGLNEVERAPSVSTTPLSSSQAPPRPLHLSQSVRKPQGTRHTSLPAFASAHVVLAKSAPFSLFTSVAPANTGPSSDAAEQTHQLFTYQQLPPSPPHQQHDLSPDQLFRSQSAEPSARYNLADKVRKFKPIKRLPKPLSSTGPGPSVFVPAPLASVTSNQPRLSPLRTTSFPSFENSASNDSRTTPSSFSLSRFPQPPNSVDPPLSPPSNENEPLRLNTVSFTTTTPATPPATPAVIHYRGASFDLVNPHHSLVLDNIVTPSRDLDSTDYLLLRSSEDALALLEMAPKRALYGDLSSAYANIIARRGDECPPHPPNLDLPLPPTPVAQSPGSSAFNSPFQSPESDVTDSPFSARKPANESRFSLKQLTRSLTQRFSKPLEKVHEEELQEFSDSRVSLASASFEGEFPRPLERSYLALTPKSSTFPDEPLTPVSPLDQAVHFMDQRRSSPKPVDQPRYSTHRVFSAPLSSMVPDEPSTQLGRAEDERRYASEGEFSTKPYYDDLASIYPSSSIYTDDDRRQSRYAPSRSNNRNSNPYWRMSGDADAITNEYLADTLPHYPGSSRRTSRRVSRPLEQEMFHRSLHQETEKTDTISKLIDHYKGTEGLNASQPLLSETGEANADHPASPSGVLEEAVQFERPDITGATCGLSQFDFDFARQKAGRNNEMEILPLDVGRAGKSTLAPHPGLPPSVPAPLAPAFEYDEAFDASKRSGPSGVSFSSPSYGDTRQLLQFSHPVIEDNVSVQPVLQPSSSYSQPTASPGLCIPTEALKQAEEIFANAASQQQTEGIPAMWSKRVSSHLLRNKSMNDLNQQQEQEQYEQEDESELAHYEDEVDIADWETVGNASPHHAFRASVGESLADYSSSEGSHPSQDSMGFSGSLPVYEDPPLDPGTFQYRHPMPLRSHSNPFTSSPPPLSVGRSMPGMALGGLETPLPSSPPASTTAPAFYGRSPDINTSGSSPRQAFIPFTPWVTPYALSDKETQELLASGPNDEILYEEDQEDAGQDRSFGSQDGSSPMQPMRITILTATTMEGGTNNQDLPRENTFEKLTVIGPKGNLTGTPHGTGMHEAGSSVADNSSPGAILDSSPLHGSTPSPYEVFNSAATRNADKRSHFPSFVTPSSTSSVSYENPGFYTSPGRRGSVNRIVPRLHTPPDSQERTPSQATLFPEESPFADPDQRASRLSLQSPITPRGPRRGSRAAVPGQTKLRQMVLASSAQTLSSSDRSVNESRLFGPADSARPSTSNTHTPLRNTASRPTLRTVIANEHSPHLLCPERAIDPEEEEVRRKLSWVIFAMFCILPPTLILYRWMGDLVIVNVTSGRFTHVAPQPKRIALGAGIAVNVSLIAALLLPILIAHAAGSL